MFLLTQFAGGGARHAGRGRDRVRGAAIPVAVDGRRLEPVALLERVNRLGAEHGIGRVDLVENRFVGMKSRGVLRDAGRHDPGRGPTRARVASRSTARCLHLRDSLVPRYAEMIYYGFWFSPEREALQRFLDECVARRDRDRAAQALQG